MKRQVPDLWVNGVQSPEPEEPMIVTTSPLLTVTLISFNTSFSPKLFLRWLISIIFSLIYYNYYVFQYSTGFSAASALAKRILSQEPDALEHIDQFYCLPDLLSVDGHHGSHCARHITRQLEPSRFCFWVPQGLRMGKNVRGHCQKETIHFDRTNRRGSMSYWGLHFFPF